MFFSGKPAKYMPISQHEDVKHHGSLTHNNTNTHCPFVRTNLNHCALRADIKE